jgi:hypothetical protein
MIKKIALARRAQGSAAASILNHISGTVEAIYLRREQEQ